MSDEPNDLSPTLGGGPIDWPHKRTPNHKFLAPWRAAEMIEQANKELAMRQQRSNEAYAGMRSWLDDRRHNAGLAMDVHLPDNASSGQAIEARSRLRPRVSMDGILEWMDN